MDFFNDIGKKFTSAAKTVQKKTKESVEITRLGGEIRGLKDERGKLFKTLGETYYEARGTDEGNERIEVILERLDQLAAREQELQAQIDRLSQQRRCPGCGNVVSIEARFCPACGERIPEEEPAPKASEAPEAEYCPNCGAMRQEYSRFCIVCGKPFEKEEGSDRIEMEITWPQASAQPEPPGEPEEEPAGEDTED